MRTLFLIAFFLIAAVNCQSENEKFLTIIKEHITTNQIKREDVNITDDNTSTSEGVNFRNIKVLGGFGKEEIEVKSATYEKGTGTANGFWVYAIFKNLRFNASATIQLNKTSYEGSVVMGLDSIKLYFTGKVWKNDKQVPEAIFLRQCPSLVAEGDQYKWTGFDLTAVASVINAQKDSYGPGPGTAHSVYHRIGQKYLSMSLSANEQSLLDKISKM